ncbi:GNAT family N-acetyltransferase [Streptomyces sp. M2CJ-2]|uniref:GNAT family N-acetyltransferase n=1 Tax=Streptomyces sp. M2CJ-2 TaxID=2803948 RepID=UPI0019283501|nr:GNAT family protein [Streptomyces sp. M2CJ-2]MBL3668942.1 GNAT family N-acetyltransferase [Streptomyces sp. M2CJ-2]
MRERVDASSGLVLRRWRAEDARAVMTAFADPLMRGQADEPVDSLQAAERWTTARGRGTASRACRAVARWAFDDTELFRLELGHRVNDPASCTGARAAGFAVEDRQRQKLEYDGVRYDVELHARLATDTEPVSWW